MNDPRPPGPRDWKCDYSIDHTAVHIRPRNDLIWHPLDHRCPCQPTINQLELQPELDTRWLIIHQARDNRAMQNRGYTPTPEPTDTPDDDDDAHRYTP